MTSRYERDFYAALDLGLANEFKAQRHSPIEGKLLSFPVVNVIKLATKDLMLGRIDLVAGECFKIHHLMKPMIERILNSPAYFTLGYIEIDGNYFHKMELHELITSLSNGPLVSERTKLHAWITLPTMEIIDLTTMTSKAVAEKRKPTEIEILWGYAGDCGVDFFPQLAANE